MKWNKIKNKKPKAYKTGMAYGKLSDKIIVADKFGEYNMVVMFEGNIHGREFCMFHDSRGIEIENVKYWAEIKSPF